MINWTLTEGVRPDGADETYWEVNGDSTTNPDGTISGDPHDPRYYPTLEAALHFLIGHKCKRSDTIHYAGADTGRVLRVGMLLDKQTKTIEYDVGTRTIPNPEELITWLVTTLQPGDTVAYLPFD